MRPTSASRIAGLVLLAMAALTGCDEQKKEGAQGNPPPPEVTVATLATQPVEITTTLPGRTSPYRVAEVRPQVTGILQKRLFKEGADVDQGEALYQIDPAVYQAAYDTAAAEVAQAKAAQVSASDQSRRSKELVKTRAVSQASADDAVSALGQANALIQAREAALESAKINLDYTTVRAPIGGRIGRSAFTAGALLTANQSEALARITQLDPIYVDVTQSSADLLKLRHAFENGSYQRPDAKQAEVTLTLEDGTPYGETGTLEFADVTVSESTGVVTLRALFPNPKAILLPGMFVRATIKVGVDPKGILVPQQAVTHDPKGRPTTLIVADGNKVEQRMLTTVQTVGDKWLVSDGVAAGDRVIVEGVQKAMPNSVVKPVEADKAVADASSDAKSAPAAPKE